MSEEMVHKAVHAVGLRSYALADGLVMIQEVRTALEAVAGDIAAARTREIADFLRKRAEQYPADVFPDDATSRDGIAGAALRDMLPRLAAEIDRREASP